MGASLAEEPDRLGVCDGVIERKRGGGTSDVLPMMP